MTARPLFKPGETVYHVADEDPGVVLAVIHYETHYAYRCVWSGRVTDEHHAVELSRDPVFTGVSNRRRDEEDDD